MFILLTLVFAGAFLVGSWQLAALYLQGQKQQRAFDALSAPRADSSGQLTDSGGASSAPSVFDRYPDMAAWVRVDGTKVDYPVMQTPEKPNYYLRRDLAGAYSSYGVPYLQENCDLDSSDNLIIYGHAFKNGAMFGSLKEYEKQSFWEQHQTVVLTTPEEPREYTIFAVFKVDVDAENCFAYWNFTAADEKAYDAFVRQAKSLSLYDTGITPAYGQQLLTLSTCEYSHANGRLAVLAVRTR